MDGAEGTFKNTSQQKWGISLSWGRGPFCLRLVPPTLLPSLLPWPSNDSEHVVQTCPPTLSSESPVFRRIAACSTPELSEAPGGGASELPSLCKASEVMFWCLARQPWLQDQLLFWGAYLQSRSPSGSFLPGSFPLVPN